jgi:glucosyl-3-phosphoglycerate synthase
MNRLTFRESSCLAIGPGVQKQPVSEWLARRSFHHLDFPLEKLQAAGPLSVSVCIPTRECAATIQRTVSTLSELRSAGVIEQVAVVDAGSKDGTATVAASSGAEVYQEAQLRPEFGEVLGKGDAMWRALEILRGDIICFVDGDSADFGRHYVLGLLGALLEAREIQFVKGFFRRPFRVGDIIIPDGGGRMTELTARPLLRFFYPDLVGVAQPLAGETAVRRSLLERLPFATGYAVEIAMLIDTYHDAGLDAIAQVDLGERQNRHRPLLALSTAADAVLTAVATRLQREGRLIGPGHSAAEDAVLCPEPDIRVIERPPTYGRP